MKCLYRSHKNKLVHRGEIKFCRMFRKMTDLTFKVTLHFFINSVSLAYILCQAIQILKLVLKNAELLMCFSQ